MPVPTQIVSHNAKSPLYLFCLINHGPLELVIDRPLRLQFICIREQKVNGLECRPCGLGVECPHDDRVDDVQHREDDVGFVADVLESRRRDFDDDEVSEEVGGGGEGGAFGADLQGEDLGWVAPDCCHPACSGVSEGTHGNGGTHPR